MNFYNELFKAESELEELESRLIEKRKHIALLNFLIAVFSDSPTN